MCAETWKPALAQALSDAMLPVETHAWNSGFMVPEAATSSMDDNSNSVAIPLPR
jgi:hypothetical protein